MDTRGRIITAAAQLFSRCGYHRTTVDDIARTAEVGKGTVYWHFSSKEKLFEGLLEEIFTHYMDEMKRIRREGGSVIGQLEKMLELRIALIRQNQPFTAVIMSRWSEGMSSESRDRLLSLHREHHKTLKDLMREGAARGELRIESAELAAMAFAGLTSELILSPQIDRPDLARELMNLLSKGIAAHPVTSTDNSWE